MKGKATLNRVKKGLLIAIACVGLNATDSFAQIKVNLGVTGGPQLTNLTSNVGKFEGIIGYNGGVSTDVRFGRMLGVTVDALWSQNGAKKEFSEPQIIGLNRVDMFTYKTTDVLNYVQFHILPKFTLPLGSKAIIPYDDPDDYKMYLSFFAGPYYALRMGVNSTGKYSGYTLYEGDTFNKVSSANYKFDKEYADRNIAPDDFGFTGGAGINFNINKGATVLGFEGRYSRSLGSIDWGYYSSEKLFVDKGIAHRKNEYADVFNSAIAFNVSLKFRIIDTD